MSLGVARRASAQSRQQTAVVVSHPVPTGGVNARDALAAMEPTDAISMNNLFPTPSYVQIRNGNQAWATGLPTFVETVMAYNGIAARKLFGASGAGIYDTTAQGAVGAAVVTALTSARWQHAMFNSGGGNVLLAVNGADAPLRYDGSAQGGVQLLTTLVGGATYTNGTYTNVALTGGAGTLAKATIVVAGAVVTAVTITSPGTAYAVGNVLSALAASIGGTGSGFSITVQTIGGWSTTTISGTNTLTGGALNPNNLITVTIFKQRTWYIENNTMNVWYGGVTAYQGALTILPLGAIFKMGGSLTQMATWTIDNVSGINDYAAFITSEGEVAVYQGYDPSAVATWSLVGVFLMGRPIGRRCIVKYGSDVLVIGADGLTPLSKALLTDRSQPDVMLTNKIMNAINADVQSYAANFGWQCIEHPIGNKLILNVPEITDGAAHQWVMNTATASNAWTQFNNWNAQCWEVQQDNLFYGTNGTVYLADVGYSDSGAAITVDVQPAFSYLDVQSEKRFLMVRPIFRTSAPLNPTITLNIDFDNQQNPAPLFTGGATAPWNTSPWNTTPWGGVYPLFLKRDWIGVSGVGYVASPRISFQTTNINYQWQSIDIMYEAGGPL